MPIEIRELHIKTTVSAEIEHDDLFLFDDTTTPAPGGEDTAPDDPLRTGGLGDPAGDDLPDLSTGDGSAAQRHHTGGVNVALCDGSVRFALDPLDLLG